MPVNLQSSDHEPRSAGSRTTLRSAGRFSVHKRKAKDRRFAGLTMVFCAALPIAACVSDPPTLEDIHLQTGTLANMPLTEGWKAGAVAGSITDNWLASFNDTQLNTLVAEAMINNNDLRVSAARVEQAGQYVELAQSALRPAVNIFGTGGANMGGGDALQYFSLGASWELDLWGRLRYGRNAYQATYASAQADFEFGRQSLAATMAKGWFTATETWLQTQDCRGHGRGRAGTGVAGGDALAGRRRQ